MNNESKRKMIFIIIILIVILSFIITIIFNKIKKKDYNLSENKIESQNITENTTENDIENDTEKNRLSENISSHENEKNSINLLESNTDTYSYFLIKNIMESYYEYSDINQIINIVDDEAKSLIVEDSDGGEDTLVSESFCIDKIYSQKLDKNLELYVVYHRTEKRGNTAIIIKINTKKQIYSIYPFEYLKEKGYTDVKDSDRIEVNSNIEENEYNSYNKNEIKTDEETCLKEIFSRNKYDLFSDRNHLYSVLDTEYKEKKFPTLEKFIQYIDQNKTDLYLEKITKYRANRNSEITEYIFMTDRNRNYTIIAKNLMQYTLLLDMYTVDSEQTKEEYNKGSSKNKAEYCLRKIINAINEKDYRFIYDKLSLTQKNKYSSFEEFANYLNRAFFEKNDFEIEDYMILNKESSYQYLIKITDSTKKEKSFRRYNIRIVLQEDMDYIVNIAQYIN